MYDIGSEVIYFEKGTKVFLEARDIYEDKRIEVNKFGAGYPDEVFFMIALEKLSVKLHASPFYPTYWQPHYFFDKVKMKTENEIRQFKILSLGGAFTASNVRRLYAKMVGASYYRMGINKPPYYSDPIEPFSKSQLLIERRLI